MFDDTSPVVSADYGGINPLLKKINKYKKKD